MLRRPRAAAVALAVSLALPVTACSGTGTRDTARAHATASDLTVSEKMKTLLQNTEFRLVNACMGRQGFQFFYQEISADEVAADERRRLPDLYGDDVEAVHSGRALSLPTSTSSTAELQEAGYLRSLSPRQQRRWSDVLDGPATAPRIKVSVPGVGTLSMATTGCFAEARTRLYGDYRTWVRVDTLVNTRYAAITDDMRQDARYTAATRAWSKCVKAHGYSYASPQDAAADTEKEHRRGSTKTAVDLARCDRDVGRSAVNRRLWSEYTETWVRQHVSDVVEFRQIYAAATRRAHGWGTTSGGA